MNLISIRFAALTTGIALILTMLIDPSCYGQEGVEPALEAAKPVTDTLSKGLAAIGAGLAIGLAAVGTGLAQGRIGAAGVGSITEKPEILPTVLIFLVIPETMVILGFVIAILLLMR